MRDIDDVNGVEVDANTPEPDENEAFALTNPDDDGYAAHALAFAGGRWCVSDGDSTMEHYALWDDFTSEYDGYRIRRLGYADARTADEDDMTGAVGYILGYADGYEDGRVDGYDDGHVSRDDSYINDVDEDDGDGRFADESDNRYTGDGDPENY